MKNFNRGGSDRRGGGERHGGGSFGRRDGRRDFGRGGSDRPEMHRATCSDCGAACEVPFKPTSGKPVFCSNCFKGKDSGDKIDKRLGGRDEKKMFKAICDECGDSCEVPFKPTAGKMVLCSDCFSKVDYKNDDNRGEDRRNNVPKAVSNEQFEMLNTKLDQILQALSAKQEVVKEKKEVAPKKATKKVTKKK